MLEKNARGLEKGKCGRINVVYLKRELFLVVIQRGVRWVNERGLCLMTNPLGRMGVENGEHTLEFWLQRTGNLTGHEFSQGPSKNIKRKSKLKIKIKIEIAINNR